MPATGYSTIFETWCWEGTGSAVANRQLFAMSRRLAGKQQISGQELEQAARQAMRDSGAGLSDEARRRIDDYMLRQIQIEQTGGAEQGRAQPAQRTPRAAAGGRGSGQPGRKGIRHSGGEQPPDVLRSIADDILKRLGPRLVRQQKDLLQKAVTGIHSAEDFLDFAEKAADELKRGIKGSAQGHSGLQTCNASDNDTDQEMMAASAAAYEGAGLSPGEYFRRRPTDPDARVQFDGILSRHDHVRRHSTGWGLAATILQMKRYSLLRKQMGRMQQQASRRSSQEISSRELRTMSEHLVRTGIVSPVFNDTFHVNQDRVSYQLAKEIFIKFSRLFPQKNNLRSGAHMSATRGLQMLQINKTRKARYVTSRIAICQTLRRSTVRRALYPYSRLLDEDDVVDYASRRKVGCSVVIAVDVSGAVQFGKRIQAVRRACMAFAYYLRRYHRYDRVRYVAYHDVPREIRFAEIAGLRSINGAGKDIGACLEACRGMLRCDPERVPAVVIIGDGLPAHADKAGFYRFMENNRDLIDAARHQARMLWKERIAFSFLQFREDRHLWQDYADNAAGAITEEAHGLLYRVDRQDDVASSLVATFEGLRTGGPAQMSSRGAHLEKVLPSRQDDQ